MDEKLERLILDLLMNQCETLNDIRKELILIREATEQANEPDPDAEPDPFQTLNGPSKDQNPLRYGVKGEYGE